LFPFIFPSSLGHGIISDFMTSIIAV
jgi:hypothetical protein